jgi:predicted nucleotidyltransferase
MLTGKTIKATLAQVLPQLQERYPIARLALFGSAVRDDFAPDRSDIDIIVELDAEMGWDYLDLYFDLKKFFPGNEVDLITRRSIKPRYWEHIKDDIQYV